MMFGLRMKFDMLLKRLRYLARGVPRPRDAPRAGRARVVVALVHVPGVPQHAEDHRADVGIG